MPLFTAILVRAAAGRAPGQSIAVLGRVGDAQYRVRFSDGSEADVSAFAFLTNELARFAEAQASDAAWTREVAAEIALQMLRARLASDRTAAKS